MTQPESAQPENAPADETQSRKPLGFQLEETPHLGWRQSWRAAPRELRTAGNALGSIGQPGRWRPAWPLAT